jgi:hypothetical protein
MKILMLLTLIVVALSGCSGTADNSSAGSAPSEPKVVYTGGGLKQVKELAGKRVRQIELWDAPDMNERLSKLAGDEYPNLKEEWVIESPITADGDKLMAAGCEMNNCDKNQWILLADIADDNINLYHIKDGTLKLYKEKGEIQVPQAFAGDFARMKSVQGVK